MAAGYLGINQLHPGSAQISADCAGCVHSVFREHHPGIQMLRYAKEMHKRIDTVQSPLKQCASREKAGRSMDKSAADSLAGEGVLTGMETNPAYGAQAFDGCL